MFTTKKLGIYPQPAGATTRDGRMVVIYRTDAPGHFCIHGVVMHGDGGWTPATWTSNGSLSPGCTRGLDLVQPEPPRFRHERWVNVWREGGIGDFFDTKQEADEWALRPDGISDPDRIACIRIVIEGQEGDGLTTDGEGA